MKFSTIIFISASILGIAACNRISTSLNASVTANGTDTVARISDGDTIVVINDRGVKERIRFACIDAPEVAHNGQTEFAPDESDQFKWGDMAKSAIAHSIHKGDPVILNRTGTDRYGRTVAEVRTTKGEFLEETLVREGLAVSYPRYDENCPSHQLIHDQEAKAISHKLNIWSDRNFVNPGEFRHNN